jgi:hypothetical protein
MIEAASQNVQFMFFPEATDFVSSSKDEARIFVV